MTIKIDKRIPPPPPRGRHAKYPIAAMKPGDSFFIPGKKAGRMGGVLQHRRGQGWKLVARTVTERGVEGVRVWRLA